jgi:hypothetical protein
MDTCVLRWYAASLMRSFLCTLTLLTLLASSGCQKQNSPKLSSAWDSLLGNGDKLEVTELSNGLTLFSSKTSGITMLVRKNEVVLVINDIGGGYTMHIAEKNEPALIVSQSHLDMEVFRIVTDAQGRKEMVAYHQDGAVAERMAMPASPPGPSASSKSP